MLIEGLNKIRDLWSNLLNAGENGTGTTQETSEDTDLETPVIGSQSTDIINTSVQQLIKKEIIFPATSAGDEDITEMIWKTSSPELAGSRITHAPSTWTTEADLVYETRWFVRGRR